MNDIKELNEWIESLNIIKMSHLSNLFYTFDAIPVKLFYKYCQIDSKIYMERHNIEWEGKAGGLMQPDLKT